MNTAAEPEEDAEMKTIPGSITKNENQGEGGGGMLCLPDNQVAGHRAEGGILGPLVDKSGRFYKPLQDNQRGENEVTFYQKFWSDQRVPPRVQHFFPRFYDTAFVQASDAPLISGQRLQKYVYHKISNEIPQGPYCVVYIHTSAQRGENCPGVSTLRLIYEELPPTFKKRLELVYFLHPGIQSRLLFATFGRFFLSAGKGQIEIPDFVYDHDDRLEDRPLMDYGIKTNPFQVYDMPAMGSADSRYSLRWTS